MKDHFEIGHLTTYDAFRVNRDQAMNLEIWFKMHTIISNVEQRPPKPYKLLKFFIRFVTTVKSRHAPATLYLKETEMKIAMQGSKLTTNWSQMQLHFRLCA